jgi:hypothetical protein
MKFTWFYFDFISEDGIQLVIVFYLRPFFLTYDIALCDICIYDQSQKNHISFSDTIQQSMFVKNPVNVRISQSTLICKDNGYLLQIQGRDFQLKLELNQQYLHWQPFSVPLYQDGRKYFKWIVYAPSLWVQGIMTINGHSTDLQGNGYLDSNEGNFPLNHALKSWMWGRFLGSSKAILFGSLSFDNGKIYQPVLVVDDKEYQFLKLHHPISLENNSFDLGDKILNQQIFSQKVELLDSIKFLISKLPANWKFFRKVHEFIFYRLDNYRWGQIINAPFSNVRYYRYLAGMKDQDNIDYQGIIEQIKFK